MKILILDIETAPNTVHVWGLWNQNVAHVQIVKPGYTLCWAAKWVGSNKVMFSSLREASHKKMIYEIHSLVDEADVVVHFNGTKFDIPTLNKEFVLLKMKPPSPYEQIDLYRTCRKAFRFPSYKLDYILDALGIGSKLPHKGHALWKECMKLRGTTKEAYDKAWKVMKAYNCQDVLEEEKLYRAILPWITSHPNWNAYNDDGIRCCVKCGSHRVHRKGWRYTKVHKYKRYRCYEPNCGTWMRGRKTQLSAETRANMLVSA